MRPGVNRYNVSSGARGPPDVEAASVLDAAAKNKSVCLFGFCRFRKCHIVFRLFFFWFHFLFYILSVRAATLERQLFKMLSWKKHS